MSTSIYDNGRSQGNRPGPALDNHIRLLPDCLPVNRKVSMNRHGPVTVDPEDTCPDHRQPEQTNVQYHVPDWRSATPGGALDPLCATSILRVVLYEFLTFRAYGKQPATRRSQGKYRSCASREHAQDSRWQCGMSLAWPHIAWEQAGGEIVVDRKLGSGEDSMMQKQANKAVGERQTRFRRISAITSDIAYYCHTQKDGRFSLDWMTGAAERITGYSIEEIKAHGCWRFLVVEEDIPLFEKNVIGLTPGSRGSCELRIRHKNGNTVWISSFAECVAAAKIPGRLLYGGLTEITERKQVEEELRASEARYRRLFEAAKDGILILDEDNGMIMDVNAFLTEMLGFSREAFLGQHIWDLGFFKGIVANEADFLKLQQKEYIRYEDMALDTADGQRINVEFVSNLYPVGQRKVIQCSIRGAHLASFPAQNPYPVIEVGTDGAVRYANPAAMATLARLGLESNVRQFLPGTPEELTLLRSQCERNPQTDELHLDGETFLKVVTAPPGGDSLHVYIIDITERKQAEDKLQVAQLQWSQVLDLSPDPMWIKDASGRYVAARKSYYHFDPSAAGNIIGKTDIECFPPEKATVYVADDRIAIETGASEGEFTAVGDDGKLRTFLTKKVILRAPDGSVAGTLGVSRDITDRKRAEEESQRERAFFDRLVESAPEGIAITDTQGRIMRVNAEFVRMFDYGVDEAVGQCLDDLVAPPARQEEARALTRSTSQGEKTLLETVRRRKDGTLVDVSLIGAPILIAGKQEALFAIYRDITERKQAAVSYTHLRAHE